MIYDFPVVNPGLHELYPLFSGCEACESRHSFGPAMRNYYLIHYVMEGRGFLQYGKKRYELSAGRCFLICPRDITYYEADEKDPWKYVWVAFNGEMAEKLIKRTGYGKHRPVIDSEKIAKVFLEISDRITGEQPSVENMAYYLLSQIYRILFYLPCLQKSGDAKDRYIDKAKEYIGSLYSRQITVEKIARLCGLNRHYLGRIFKERVGVTPQNYLLDIRLENAYALLISSELSVSEIALSVGYSDVYNFSKMFKKKYKASPLKTRRQYAEQQNRGEGKLPPGR